MAREARFIAAISHVGVLCVSGGRKRTAALVDGAAPQQRPPMDACDVIQVVTWVQPLTGAVVTAVLIMLNLLGDVAGRQPAA
jgi:hypothetical protein